ncbi:MAG TPA: DNA repair protein RecO [Chitinophagales bacterium]|nr:DNA repair protein RecO [Chitinophagales bacterium]HMW12844.1 DNA repair protein RecO [Chitinophagales bacterium]HMX59420.1 DNA repair protein RecO [Chitinophagales bacterium]HMY24111.1 DNA repair protein RecO [Chitinophagales bacterium]HMZ34480.1 DNA repair protein RecO [Chitinophagales bacterium]
MLDKTEGIVLRQVRYAESSMIISIFTQKYGLLSFMVQGVRSNKSKQKGNMLQVLNILMLDIYLKEQRNLNRIKEHSAAYIYKNIPNDFAKQSIGIFCIELISKCIKEQEVNERLYQYLVAFLIDLDNTKERIENKPLFFLLEMASILGFEPSLQNILHGIYFNLESGRFEDNNSHTQNCLSAHETELLKKLIAMYYEKNDWQFNSMERKILLDKLLLYFRWHIAEFTTLKSPAVLSEILR